MHSRDRESKFQGDEWLYVYYIVIFFEKDFFLKVFCNVYQDVVLTEYITIKNIPMKTTTKNQYAYANNILIALVSAVFGYNLYQAIVHPDHSNIALSLILVVLTSIMVRKYGNKPTKEKQKDI